LSSVRVTYSGLIAFIVGIGSILTGTVFTLIITRQLSVEEFGTWNLIGSIIAYTLLLESPIFFWITREIARDKLSAKTGIITSGMFSSIGMLVYVIVANVIGQQSNADVTMMILAVILIPVNFLNHTLIGINAGWKPHIVSYGFITIEITKIPIALALIYYLELGILGVIITVLLSTCASIIIQLYYAKPKLKNRFEKKFVKKWLKLSWVALYKDIPGTLYISDVIIFSTITGNVTGIAYITAARAIGNLVRHSGNISTAIYPKMLAGGKHEHLQENLIRTLYFAFPTIAFSIVFARAGVFALNPEYEIAASIVIFLSFRTFFATLNRIFRSAIQGVDKVDVVENAGFKNYIKSSLIVVPTIRTIQYASYVILLISGLYFLVENQSSQFELVNYWAIITVCVEIPFVIYFVILVRRKFVLNLNFKIIFKYGISSFVSFGITHLLMERYLIYDISIFNFLPNLMLFVTFGIIFYLGFTYLIDKKTRQLFKMIIKEIRNK
jgi:O-antigen/teichoic acid export membrane protein